MKAQNDTRLREQTDTCARVVNNGWEADTYAYEFNSRSVNNTFVALFDRFLNSSLEPDAACTVKLGQIADSVVQYIMARDPEYNRQIVESFNPLEWLQSREYGEGKKQEYFT